MIRGTIAKYARKMTELGYSTGDGHRILFKEKDGIYATAKGADFADMRDEDIVKLIEPGIPERKVLASLGKVNAMVISEPEYCFECIRRGRSIPAVLDDFAQIIGVKAHPVYCSERAMTSALKSSAGILVKPCRGCSDGFAVTVGRDPYEAYVAMTVMEKSAEVLLKADVLGGAKPLGPVKANVERRIYLYRYSKPERKNNK
mgnify:FL=1